MTQIQQKCSKAVAEALATTKTGGGEIEITGSAYATSLAHQHVREAIYKAGFRTRLKLRPDGITVIIEPRDDYVRPGKPRSALREQIEGINPGISIAYDLDDVDVYRLRNMIQAVRRTTGREFITSQDKPKNAIIVTRIDSAEQMSPQLAETVRNELGKRSVWPFSRLAPGEFEVMPNTANIESARSMAQYHKSKYGVAFSVRKTKDGLTITRKE